MLCTWLLQKINNQIYRFAKEVYLAKAAWKMQKLKAQFPFVRKYSKALGDAAISKMIKYRQLAN